MKYEIYKNKYYFNKQAAAWREKEEEGGGGRIEFKILSREEMNVLFFFVVQN